MKKSRRARCAQDARSKGLYHNTLVLQLGDRRFTGIAVRDNGDPRGDANLGGGHVQRKDEAMFVTICTGVGHPSQFSHHHDVAARHDFRRTQ
jgi:hypothetical protein